MKTHNSISIYSGASPDQVAEDLQALLDFNHEGLSLEALSELLEAKLLPHLMQYDQPGFQSMFNAFPEEGAKLGAQIALDFNQGVTNWQVSPGGAMLEELCCRVLCKLFGFPPEADATFMYCGTYANQQALYMALHQKAEQCGFDFSKHGMAGFSDGKKLAVAISKDAHFSLKHAVRILGLGEESLITLAVDKNRRIDIDRMKIELAELQTERDVFCVVATAGTTSTGTVDPLLPLAAYCQEQHIWLHVDGAYGLAYSLVPEWKPLFAGIEQANSVCWDPHKQLGIPIPNSLLFVRNWKDFGRMAVFSSYFNRDTDVEPNPGLKSPPSTRPFSALPLVTSFLHQGMERVIQRLRAPVKAIQDTYQYLKTQDDIELWHQPDTGILCFRFVPEGFPEDRLHDLQQAIYSKIMSEGKRSISMTTLDDTTVLRVLAISPAVTCEALLETIAAIRKVAQTM